MNEDRESMLVEVLNLGSEIRVCAMALSNMEKMEEQVHPYLEHRIRQLHLELKQLKLRRLVLLGRLDDGPDREAAPKYQNPFI
ncbi:hypothetical protein [Paraburkholderia sp. BR14320]|uniref:hypothetical protein n=1 Tax=unclassified Paraburkholderia TaxID=2615204 RepID=UPI0034CFB06C